MERSSLILLPLGIRLHVVTTATSIGVCVCVCMSACLYTCVYACMSCVRQSIGVCPYIIDALNSGVLNNSILGNDTDNNNN